MPRALAPLAHQRQLRSTADRSLAKQEAYDLLRDVVRSHPGLIHNDANNAMQDRYIDAADVVMLLSSLQGPTCSNLRRLLVADIKKGK